MYEFEKVRDKHKELRDQYTKQLQELKQLQIASENTRKELDQTMNRIKEISIPETRHYYVLLYSHIWESILLLLYRIIIII